MLRSMYTAVSGLRAHQFKMDIIGNNIANVNTVGFKKSQVSFAEAFSQNIRGASAPQGGRGGTNPQQVGLGVNIGSVRVVHDGGSPQRTDNPLDFYIGGEGFFVVSGDPNFNNRLFTRAGNFDLDRDGNLVTAEGLKVLGYKADKDGNITDTIGDIKINKSETKKPSSTENLQIKGNLNANEKDGESFTTDTKIYDSLGNPYTVKFKFTKTTTGWKQDISGFIDSNGNDLYKNEDKDGNALKDATGKEIKDKIIDFEFLDLEGNAFVGATFNSKGELNEINKVDAAKKIGKDALYKIKIKIKPSAASPQFIGNGTFGKNASGDVDLDFKGLTQYGNETTAKAYKKDGNTSGTIESFTVSTTGEVVGVFTNGERKTLGQLAIAKFDNAGGLQKEGSNNFVDTRNSGEPQYGKAGGSGYGQVLGGAVEMSNVDLSYEFTEMITTQRGFQANSRVITTSDEILQELVNLKR